MQKIQISIKDHYIYPIISKFPGGEVLVNCKPNVGTEECRIEAVLTNSDDIMALVMIVDSLREQGVTKIRLTMPYVPYARQDRVCNQGEALSIRAFAKIINSLKFSSVVVYDPHSDVTPALIDRCIVVPRYDLMSKHQHLYDWICRETWAGHPLYLVSPDAGAVKKTYDIAKKFPQFKGIIFAEKVRDVVTGNIIKTSLGQIPDDISDANLLVCDDICDGGRTFIELGKLMRNNYEPREMNLYVTHGIFSHGIDVLTGVQNGSSYRHYEVDKENNNFVKRTDGYFDNVWCTIDFRNYN